MRSFTSLGLTAFCAILTLISSVAFAQKGVQRPEEMEFDTRVIQGQRAEGAVYLFQRAVRPLPPLLNYKRDYLSSVIVPVFGRDTEIGQKALARLSQSELEIAGVPQSKPAKPQVTPVQPDARSKSQLKKSSSKKVRRRKRRRKSKSRRRGKKQ